MEEEIKKSSGKCSVRGLGKKKYISILLWETECNALA